MLACFKKNDFNQALCAKEISNFQGCYKDFMVMEISINVFIFLGICLWMSHKMGSYMINANSFKLWDSKRGNIWKIDSKLQE